MLSLNISKNLFWDVDTSKIDDIQNKRLIIERVFTMGDLQDVVAVIQFYGLKTVKHELMNAGYLDNKTLSWVSTFFNIPKSKFKCFIKKQSTQIHWSY